MSNNDFDSFNFLKGFIVGIVFMFILTIVMLSLRY